MKINLEKFFTNKMKALLVKEIRSYFNSPIAYIVIGIFLLISGWFFTSSLFLIGQSSLLSFLNIVPLILTFFVPAVTMRLFSEELRMGTVEVLTTLPLKDNEIVFAKYAASIFVIKVSIALTLIFPLTLLLIGKIDPGEILCSYIALVCLSSAYAAIGLFTSSITKNQIIAFITSFIICFMLFLAGKTIALAPSGLVNLLDYIGMDSHFNNMMRGVIDTRDVIYFGSIIVFFYILTLSWFSTRKWK